MRRNGEMICKLGGETFQSVFSELRAIVEVKGLDMMDAGGSFAR
jgi:hypothetical protein